MHEVKTIFVLGYGPEEDRFKEALAICHREGFGVWPPGGSGLGV